MTNLEICINADSQQSVKESVSAAYEGGASRIELCGAMQHDGLTPAKQQIIDARESFHKRPGLLTMIRPRAGDFTYSDEEISLMCNQIEIAADSGTDGVVFGALNIDNTISIKHLNSILKKCEKLNLQTTFHRAFDATPNFLESLDILIESGINRILTGGTKWGDDRSAIEGIKNLEKIINKAEDKIEVVIGGGIDSKNINIFLERLPISNNLVSFHAFSGVQVNGITTKKAVESLVDAANIL